MELKYLPQNKISAFTWGFAEATCFFIVPDVLLSLAALNDLRKSIILCIFAVFGAAIGGMLIFELSRIDEIAMQNFLVRIPAIGELTMQSAKQHLIDHGIFGVCIGAYTGNPFKVYAYLCGVDRGINLLAFVLLSIPARLSRFVCVCAGTRLIERYALKGLSQSIKFRTWLFCWIIFYVFYFFVVAH